MNDDIVTRLREWHPSGRECEEAADEIERLRADREVLKQALYLSCKNLAGEMWGNWSDETFDEYVQSSVDYWTERAQEGLTKPSREKE